MLRPRLHGAGERRAVPLLPVQRQEAQHLLAPRHMLPRALHPGRPARRAGVAGPVRACWASRSRSPSAVARAHGGAWLPQELLARRETLRRGQAHLRQQLERLTDAYLRAVIPLDEYERRRRDLEQRVRALAGQEEQLRHDAARQQQLAGVAASARGLPRAGAARPGRGQLRAAPPTRAAAHRSGGRHRRRRRDPLRAAHQPGERARPLLSFAERLLPRPSAVRSRCSSAGGSPAPGRRDRPRSWSGSSGSRPRPCRCR